MEQKIYKMSPGHPEGPESKGVLKKLEMKTKNKNTLIEVCQRKIKANCKKS